MSRLERDQKSSDRHTMTKSENTIPMRGLDEWQEGLPVAAPPASVPLPFPF
jgi:hypothetical protein